MAATAFPSTLFGLTTGGTVAGICFVFILASACVFDIRERRIPNTLVGILAVVGLLFGMLQSSPGVGVARAVIGLGIGFVLWLPFYAMNMLGAGDVKLFAAASCWFAPSQVLIAALLSALIGGVLAVISLLLAHGFGLTSFRIAQLLGNPRAFASPLAVPTGRPTLPYGLAMAIGLIAVGWVHGLSRLF